MSSLRCARCTSSEKGLNQLSVSDLVIMLASAMQATGGTLAIAEDEKSGFADKLTRLLTLPTLARTSKVEQLKLDHPSIFFDAKILTDLRPVFDKPGDRPIGGIIINTLKTVSHEGGGEHKEFYFELDSDDVITLKNVAQRAIQKIASLKQFMKSADLQDLS